MGGHNAHNIVSQIGNVDRQVQNQSIAINRQADTKPETESIKWAATKSLCRIQYSVNSKL